MLVLITVSISGSGFLPIIVGFEAPVYEAYEGDEYVEICVAILEPDNLTPPFEANFVFTVQGSSAIGM